MISETVSTLPMRFAAQSATFETFKRREITDKDAHDLSIRLWDADAIGVLEIPRLIREWREPAHQEFVHSGKTAWRLFNAATEIIKGDLWRLPARTRTVHTVLEEAFGLRTHTDGESEQPAETVEVVA
jgi:hypothetical protein